MVIYLIFAVCEIFILKKENIRLQKLRDAKAQKEKESDERSRQE